MANTTETEIAHGVERGVTSAIVWIAAVAVVTVIVVVGAAVIVATR